MNAELASPAPEFALVPYFDFVLSERLPLLLRNDARKDD